MMLRRIVATFFVLASGCKTPSSQSALKDDDSQDAAGLAYYEALRILDLAPTKSCSSFTPEQRITVTKRDQVGNAIEGEIKVLSDNPQNEIWVAAGFNQWGAAKTPEDKLSPVAGTPYFKGRIRALSHGMAYRLVVNGVQLLDPAATVFTTPEYSAAQGDSGVPYLNSVFWDFEHPSGYKMTTKSVDLRRKPLIIAEGEVFELARKWKSQNQVGPKNKSDTYKFVADSGLISELKSIGYNAVEFLPFNSSMDGEHWHYRYQVYGLFAPDSRYGTPDDFARMIDAFNKNGIAVIMDAVVGHYPHSGNEGARTLQPVGPHNWKKADGKRLYGQELSPWGTYRYDYANPYIRRFLTDSVLHMMCRYGISGIRFDNLDGIKDYGGPGGGGPEFLKMLMGELRSYKPESILIGEMFFGNNAVMQRMDQGGFGINFRTHSDYFDFLKDNMQKSTEAIDIERVKRAIRDPWAWKEAARVQYVTNHDEAANRRDGATGAYVATLLNGGGWHYVEKKSIVFGSLSLLSSSAYLDMPQMRLLQEGTFNDDSAVNWELKNKESQGRIYRYFADLSKAVKDKEAFAFINHHSNIENHVDTYSGWRIISVLRRDAKTGKKYYGLINLGHVGISNYRFGVDAGGAFAVLIDSDDKAYGGSGELKKRLPQGILDTEANGVHGKPRSLSIPYLAPYAAILLESQ